MPDCARRLVAQPERFSESARGERVCRRRTEATSHTSRPKPMMAMLATLARSGIAALGDGFEDILDRLDLERGGKRSPVFGADRTLAVEPIGNQRCRDMDPARELAL